jgi:hypothetical protein
MPFGKCGLWVIAICYAAAMENENARIFVLTVTPE